MNPQIYSFGLFLLWSVIAFAMLVIVPQSFPKFAADGSRNIFMACGAAMLALWNLLRWWTVRGFLKSQRLREQLERQWRHPPTRTTEPKPIVNPEFQFDEPTQTPTLPPNGTSN